MEFDLEKIDTPEGGRNYLENLNDLIKDEDIYQVLVFGSGSRSDINECSDLDILIVLEKKNAVKKLEASVRRLNRKALDDVGWLEYKFDQLTGAFIWGEITDRDSFRTGNFSKIFRFPRIANFTTAWRVFLKSAFGDAKIIYGPEQKPVWLDKIKPRRYWLRELTKNLFTSFGLSLLALFYSFLSERGSEYTQEAYKITLYGCYVLLEDESPTIDSSLNRIPDVLGVQELFIESREGSLQSNFKFAVLVPLVILLTHYYTAKQILAESRFL